MKIFVRRNDLIRAMRIYQDELDRKFKFVPLTPATVQRVNAALNEMRAQLQRMERNPVWHVPVVAEAGSISSIVLTVVENPDIEIID